MKKLFLPLFCLMLMFSLSGCGLVEDAFKAGLIFAFVIVAIIGVLIWIFRIVLKQFNKQPTITLNAK